MNMGEKIYFTSESVTEGHPDKVADQIADAVLDAYLEKDPGSRVAVEVMVTSNYVLLAGEVTSQAQVDVEPVARQVIKDIGYVYEDLGFDYLGAQIEVRLHAQSPDIARGVDIDQARGKPLGAGDQGIMYGYACEETDRRTHAFAHNAGAPTGPPARRGPQRRDLALPAPRRQNPGNGGICGRAALQGGGGSGLSPAYRRGGYGHPPGRPDPGSDPPGYPRLAFG